MSIITTLLGQDGIVVLIGIIVFLISYKYSVNIFEWIENNTYGTRNYILEKLELLFIEVNPNYITYLLLFLSFGLGLFVVLLFGFFSMWITGVALGFLVTIAGWKLPKPIINYMVTKRVQAYQNQMTDGLILLANGIRAGLSVPQAIGMVVDEMAPPISQEFGLILQQNRIGIPLEECFESLAKRMPTEDNDMFVAGVNILRETGGNLAETFDTIVSVIRERIRLKQKIEGYIAQGMIQGLTIFSMPFVIGIIYAMTDPKSMIPMFTTPFGIFLTILALGFDIAGGLVILKIVKIKV